MCRKTNSIIAGAALLISGLALSKTSQEIRAEREYSVQLNASIWDYGYGFDQYFDADTMIHYGLGLNLMMGGGYGKVGFKKFHGNSFFTNTGLIYFSGLDNHDPNNIPRYARWGVDASFGQEWQWEGGFTLKLTYLGVALLEKQRHYKFEDDFPEEEKVERHPWPRLFTDIKPYGLGLAYAWSW